MTGPEHYRAAEQLLADAREIPSLRDESNPAAALLLAEAQVHATLALAAPLEPADPAALMDVLISSLAEFQLTAQYSSLQHPQMRGHLAEHLTNSLSAAGFRNGAR